MRKNLIFFSVSVFLLCIVLITALFQPVPILEDSDEIIFLRITYNPSYRLHETSDFIVIADYNQDEVLNCLSKYVETPMLKRADGYSLDDVELEIVIHSENELKMILLGDINEVSYGHNSFLRQVEDGESLRKELKKILNLES